MFLRRPKLTLSNASLSIDLLRDALAQYHVTVRSSDTERQLNTLGIDDLDFAEAVELVEAAIGVKIDSKSISPRSTIAEIAALFDAARNSAH